MANTLLIILHIALVYTTRTCVGPPFACAASTAGGMGRLGWGCCGPEGGLAALGWEPVSGLALGAKKGGGPGGWGGCSTNE